MQRVLECLRKAENLAEQLNDDRRRGRVCAFMALALSMLGHQEEAVTTGSRAVEIAESLGRPEAPHPRHDHAPERHTYYRSDYERVVELATANLAALPADWGNESFGRFAPASIYDRVSLIRGLAELGRFDEAARHGAEVIRAAESTYHAYTVGIAHWTAGTLYLLKGNWTAARAGLERGIAALRTASAALALPSAVSCAAWVLAQLGEAREALDRLA